jgi:hypothetical protein
MTTITDVKGNTFALLKLPKKIHHLTLKAFLLIGILSFLFVNESKADHFRYGNVTWTRSGMTVTFKINMSFNNLSSYYSFPGGYAVGQQVTPNFGPIEIFDFGDGSAQVTVMPATITEINVTEGWFSTTRTLVHTYSTPTNKIAFLTSGGLRDVSLSNNAGLSYRVETTVNFVTANIHTALPNNSPVSTMPSKVYLAIGLNPATFPIAAFDPDGNPITFSLSNATQMGNPSAIQPPTFSVNPTTGVASFVTVGRTIGSEWNASVRVTDSSGAAITIDIVMEMVSASTPPVFNYPPTPPNATNFTVQHGTPLSFTVQAHDNDPGDFVILTAPGLPIGATMSPGLPLVGNPVNTLFSWTPTLADVGGHVINFTAKDGHNVQTFSSVNILVTALPVFDVPPTPTAGSFYCLTPGVLYTTPVQAHSLDPLVTVQITGASIPPAATLAPGLPTPAANTTSTTLSWTPAVTDFGVHAVSFTATDNHSLTQNHNFNLIVNTVPAFLSTQGNLTLCAGTPFSYTIVIDDPDMAYGDLLNIFGNSLPPWLTLNQTGPNTALLSGTPGPGDAGLNVVDLEVWDTYSGCHGDVNQTFNIVVFTSVNDFNLCTIDGCDNLLGPTYSPVNVDDGNTCTEDACDPLIGITHTEPFINVSVTPLNPILCYGGTTCVDVSVFGGTPPYAGDGTICNINGGIIDFTITDDHGCTATSIPVFIPQPFKLSAIATPTPTSCAVNNGTVFVVAFDGTPGYSYEWRNSSNSIVGTSDLVTGLGGDTYTVTVTDANGCTETASAMVTVIGGPPAAPSPISGPPGVCKGQNGVQFCVTPDPSITNYIWTLPNGVTGSSTTNCITVNISTKFTGGMICVVAHNACGNSGATCKSMIVLTAKPAKPSPVSGPSPVCAGTQQTYCVSPVPNTASYLWTIGGNGGANPITISSGQGTPCVVVNIPAGYNANQELKVKAQNCKGNSDERKLVISVVPIPGMPGTMTGPSSVCKSQLGFYSVPNVINATTYNWTVSGNVWIAGGQGTNAVALDFNTSNTNSAIISVTASNVCGTSAPRTKTVNINTACRSAAGIISGATTNSIDVSVYPNPVNSEVSIDFNSTLESNCLITLVDLTGKLVLQTEMKSVVGDNHKVLDLSSIAKGAYLLILNTQEERSVTRLFVE